MWSKKDLFPAGKRQPLQIQLSSPVQDVLFSLLFYQNSAVLFVDLHVSSGSTCGTQVATVRYVWVRGLLLSELQVSPRRWGNLNVCVLTSCTPHEAALVPALNKSLWTVVMQAGTGLTLVAKGKIPGVCWWEIKLISGRKKLNIYRIMSVSLGRSGCSELSPVITCNCERVLWLTAVNVCGMYISHYILQSFMFVQVCEYRSLVIQVFGQPSMFQVPSWQACQ